MHHPGRGGRFDGRDMDVLEDDASLEDIRLDSSSAVSTSP
jgi:hypothetical protein